MKLLRDRGVTRAACLIVMCSFGVGVDIIGQTPPNAKPKEIVMSSERRPGESTELAAYRCSVSGPLRQAALDGHMDRRLATRSESHTYCGGSSPRFLITGSAAGKRTNLSSSLEGPGCFAATLTPPNSVE